jgi:hypothetical protein
MASDGFSVAGYDGISEQGGRWNGLSPPFPLAGVRPDAWGIHPSTMMFAFAEAKTRSDIDTAHTRRQLRIFSSVKMRASGSRCPLYVAVPQSCLHTLDFVLGDMGLASAENIMALGLPDVLLRAA